MSSPNAAWLFDSVSSADAELLESYQYMVSGTTNNRTGRHCNRAMLSSIVTKLIVDEFIQNGEVYYSHDRLSAMFFTFCFYGNW